MPKAPSVPFLTITCPSCDWKAVIRQRSDAIIAPGICPSCGNDNLKHSFTGHIESFLTSPVSYVDTLLKGTGLT